MDIFEMGMPQNTTSGERFHVCRHLDGEPQATFAQSRWRTLTEKEGCYQSFDTLESAKDWARTLHERGVVVHAIGKVKYSGQEFITIKSITNPKPFKPTGEYRDYGSW